MHALAMGSWESGYLPKYPLEPHVGQQHTAIARDAGVDGGEVEYIWGSHDVHTAIAKLRSRIQLGR